MAHPLLATEMVPVATHPFLPAVHQSLHPPRMPIHSHLLTICAGSHSETRSFQRLLPCRQAHPALPSLGRLWLRPCSLDCRPFNITHTIKQVFDFIQRHRYLNVCAPMLTSDTPLMQVVEHSDERVPKSFHVV